MRRHKLAVALALLVLAVFAALLLRGLAVVAVDET